MKLPNTRIRVDTFADGTLLYTPQYKGWFFWNSFKQWHFEFYTYYQFTDIVLAKQKIDEFLADEKKKLDKKINKVHYIKYP